MNLFYKTFIFFAHHNFGGSARPLDEDISTFRVNSRLSRLTLLFFLLPTSYFLLFSIRVFRGQNIFRFFLLFLLPTSYFLLFSCSSLTNPDKTTISGTVKLEGQTDYSGVKVSLYKLVDLDRTLVRINQQYPNISIHISLEINKSSKY